MFSTGKAGRRRQNTARKIVRMEVMMISTPTISVNSRAGRREARPAASGAAMTPPMSRPAMAFQLRPLTVKKKVMLSATVTKNSAALTEPTVKRVLELTHFS